MFSGVASWVSILSTLGLVGLGEEDTIGNLTVSNLFFKTLILVYPIYLLMKLDKSIVATENVIEVPENSSVGYNKLLKNDAKDGAS